MLIDSVSQLCKLLTLSMLFMTLALLYLHTRTVIIAFALQQEDHQFRPLLVLMISF